MNGPNFFRIKDNENNGNLVFENHDGVISTDTVFLDVIYSILANRNLSLAEQELIKRGFIAYPITNSKQDESVPVINCDASNIVINSIFTKEDWISLLNEFVPEIELNENKRRLTF